MLKIKQLFKKIFNPKWGFDFKITIDNHVVTAIPGQHLSIPVKVTRIHGESQPVKLTVITNWESAGITAHIPPREIDPSQEWVATMSVGISTSTKPGNYLFTVRGEIRDTFNTSQDTITIIVGSKDNQKSDKKNTQDNFQNKLSNNIDESSFSLDNLFVPKSTEQDSLAKNSGGNIKSVQNSSTGNSAISWIMASIVVGIIFAIVISMGDGGVTGGSIRTCVSSSGSWTDTSCSDCDGSYKKTVLNQKYYKTCRGAIKKTGSRCVLQCK